MSATGVWTRLKYGFFKWSVCVSNKKEMLVQMEFLWGMGAAYL